MKSTYLLQNKLVEDYRSAIRDNVVIERFSRNKQKG